MKKFSWSRKKEKQNKEEQPNTMSTLDEVKKAYADLSEEDKKSFHQSLKDRVDESVGEQEHNDGTEDTQTAKDRVDEAVGDKIELVDGRKGKVTNTSSKILQPEQLRFVPYAKADKTLHITIQFI